SLTLLALFFRTYSAHHPHLPSFPTRRSSDLYHEERAPAPAASAGGLAPRAVVEYAREVGAGCARHRDQPEQRAGRGGLHDGARRSEEHTSELQSRGHLVCRLLLEKKKKKNRN